MNKFIGIGRLTKDPELKTTQSGVNYTNFTIAIPRTYNRDEADFINCVAWRQTAEFICKWFSKGSNIDVVGSLQVRSWEDQNQNRNYITEVEVKEAEFAGSKNDGQATTNTAQPTFNNEFYQLNEEGDDLPF